MWLVATGRRGAARTRARATTSGRARWSPACKRTTGSKDVRLALSLDEVGRGTPLRPALDGAEPRADVEQRILDAGDGRVRWVRDPAGEGNSDHRELARAGAPAAKLGVVDEHCRHTACDTPDRLERGAFTRVLRIVWPLLRTWT